MPLQEGYRVPNSRDISHRTLQVTRAKYQYSVFMFSCRGSRESISFSRSDFSSLFDARCDDCSHAQIGEAGVNPVESPNVTTNFVDCVLDKLVMKSRYKSSLPKSSILMVQCRRKGEKKLWCNWTTTPICKECTFSAGFNKTENRIRIDYFMYLVCN